MPPFSQKFKVAFKGRVKSPAMKALKQLLKTEQPLIELVDKKEVADYWILEQENGIALCQRETIRPIFKNVPITKNQQDGTFTSALLFQQQLLQVAHFEHIRKIANPNSIIKIAEVLDIQLAEVTEHQNFQQIGKLVPKDPNETLFLNYHAHEEDLVNPAIQLKVKNKATHSLWVTALFLAEDYSIFDLFMPVKELTSGAPAYEFAIPDSNGFNDPTIRLVRH